MHHVAVAVVDDETLRARWNRDAALRAAFSDFAAFAAYVRGARRGADVRDDLRIPAAARLPGRLAARSRGA